MNRRKLAVSSAAILAAAAIGSSAGLAQAADEKKEKSTVTEWVPLDGKKAENLDTMGKVDSTEQAPGSSAPKASEPAMGMDEADVRGADEAPAAEKSGNAAPAEGGEGAAAKMPAEAPAGGSESTAAEVPAEAVESDHSGVATKPDAGASMTSAPAAAPARDPGPDPQWLAEQNRASTELRKQSLAKVEAGEVGIRVVAPEEADEAKQQAEPGTTVNSLDKTQSPAE